MENTWFHRAVAASGFAVLLGVFTFGFGTVFGGNIPDQEPGAAEEVSPVFQNLQVVEDLSSDTIEVTRMIKMDSNGTVQSNFFKTPFDSVNESITFEARDLNRDGEFGHLNFNAGAFNFMALEEDSAQFAVEPRAIFSNNLTTYGDFYAADGNTQLGTATVDTLTVSQGLRLTPTVVSRAINYNTAGAKNVQAVCPVGKKPLNCGYLFSAGHALVQAPGSAPIGNSCFITFNQSAAQQVTGTAYANCI